MTRVFLAVLFVLILAAMLAVTTYASLDRSIFSVRSQMTSDPWFQATLADAYFGFLTFYVWVAYKEPSVWRKLLWFVLIMTLGDVALLVNPTMALGLHSRNRVFPDEPKRIEECRTARLNGLPLFESMPLSHNHFSWLRVNRLKTLLFPVVIKLQVSNVL
jgi:hypothetical protein